MKPSKAAICYTAALTAFTVFLALQTFVIPRAYSTAESEIDLSAFTAEESAGSESSAASDAQGSSGSTHRQKRSGTTAGSGSVSSETVEMTGAEADSYSDENISITLKTYEVCDTAVYVADVQLSSAQYLKTAFANDTFGRNITEKTSVTAAAHDAILAVNGDFYGAHSTGYVIRNGTVYRNSSTDADLLCVYTDGSMQIVSSDDKTAEELAAEGVWQAFCFGPGLVEDGQVTVSAQTEVGRAMASNPRTAVGMIDPLHYLFVVSDGRTEESAGLSLLELAEFMQSLGADTAYNLDGGGSSSMYFLGRVVNQPTTTGSSIKERSVSDIVYIR